LGHSIHIHSIRFNNASLYDYALYAFVHIDAIECAEPLKQLGYTVQIMPQLPFDLDRVHSKLRLAMEQKGCCGPKEFLKLNVFSLTSHPIAVHLDADTLLVKPMDELWDSMLLNVDAPPSSHLASIQHHYTESSVIQPSSLDFLFTRDYHQQSQYSLNPKHYGVQ
jgi:hypothetical protein